MAAGLRERWRLKAMTTIQECALDLFDERGFDAVTIEQIAAAAEVSPSSVYRYFGTKEGLIVADEFDTMGQESLEELLDVTDPVGSLVQVVRTYEAAPTQGHEETGGRPRAAGGPWRRVRYFFQEPSVRMAACAALDRASQRIAPLMATRGEMSETQARVAAHALVFGYFAALEQWYLNGGTDPIADYVDEGMLPLRSIWPTSPQASDEAHDVTLTVEPPPALQGSREACGFVQDRRGAGCEDVAMIKRIHPYADGGDLAASRDFYVGVFGLEVAMEDPVLGLVSPTNPAAQVIIPPHGMEDPPPRLGIDVGEPDAVDAAHAEVVRRGLRVVYPLTDEPWGVRRFFVEDPGGTVVNVLAHHG